MEEWWLATSTALNGEQAAVEALKKYYQPSCAVCSTFYDEAKAIAGDGNHVEEGDQRVIDVRFDANEGNSALVISTIESQPGRLVSSDGEVLDEYAGGEPVIFAVNLRRLEEGGWVIQDILSLGAQS